MLTSCYRLNECQDVLKEFTEMKGIKPQKPQKYQQVVSQQDSIAAYTEILQTCFIIQYKINQVSSQLQVMKEPSEYVLATPRFNMQLLKLAVNSYAKKRVSVEFQGNGGIEQTIAQVFDSAVITHLKQVIQNYLRNYSDLVSLITKYEIPPLSPVTDYTLWKAEQRALWDSSALNSIHQHVEKMDSQGLANLVESILESTRKTKSLQDTKNDLTSIKYTANPSNQMESQVFDIYKIQGEFVSQGGSEVEVQKLLIPGLTKKRFLNFTNKSTFYKADENTLQKLKELDPDNFPILEQEHLLTLQMNKPIGLRETSFTHPSLGVFQQEAREEFTPCSKKGSARGTCSSQQDSSNMREEYKVEDLQLESCFQQFMRWKDILRVAFPHVKPRHPETKEIIQYVIQTPEQWHAVLMEPHLRMIVDQMGLSIDDCIRRLALLSDTQLFDLAGDAQLQTRDSNKSLAQSINQMNPSRTLGILLYSSPQILHELDSVQILIKHLDTIDQLLYQQPAQ